ncbi:hypothetical protein [Litorihabitans aurantiacus]|uniref:Uncharacterized protein n=1 Tax=Litorihabitans aurantiacus TaxID=1930061 RepID=A0AA37UMZ3_9MICO|nr:hypothetical protein [Litorihabitans aurantiacus]GMA30964.1 hypothetical protein GCM10025875_09560 [Litorihabitans aurantiacus]
MAERSRRRSTIASATVVSLVVGTVVALSLTYDGVATADVSLNDGGVWVTGTNDTRIGRLNYPIAEVDAQLSSSTAAFDILQDDEDVLVVDDGLGRVERIDTAGVVGAGGAAVPAGRTIDLGAGTVAVLDPGTGDLRIVTTDTLAALEDEELPPTLRVSPRSVLDVDVEGTTWVFDPDTRALTALTASDVAVMTAIARGEGAEDEEGDAPVDEEAPADDASPSDAGAALAATGLDGADVEDLEPPSSRPPTSPS